MENTHGLLNQGTDRYRYGTPMHRTWLAENTKHQFDFFRASMGPKPGFHVLDYDGAPLNSTIQELHTTTRLTHSFALGKLFGVAGCDDIIDKGMSYIWHHHRDTDYGGYLWALDGNLVHNDRKLAYGHAFVLLAASSAKIAGHPDADRLIDDVSTVLDVRFWEEERGLFADEWTRDWSLLSTYRGMNANMHAVEALLTAFEATGRETYLSKAGRILDFFVHKIGAKENWRLPEHYTVGWQIDRYYAGDPMFKPAGTTPGHSFELSRLLLQYWDLSGRPDDLSRETAWKLIKTALSDAWDTENGGLFYTINFDGTPASRSRYWWPVTEAIGALASFLKLEETQERHMWYSRLWRFSEAHFIDRDKGGWFPEINAFGKPENIQFVGKPDIYHSIQATLFPLTTGLSRNGAALHSHSAAAYE